MKCYTAWPIFRDAGRIIFTIKRPLLLKTTWFFLNLIALKAVSFVAFEQRTRGFKVGGIKCHSNQSDNSRRTVRRTTINGSFWLVDYAWLLRTGDCHIGFCRQSGESRNYYIYTQGVVCVVSWGNKKKSLLYIEQINEEKLAPKQ